MGDPENKFQKIQISHNEILRMKFYAFFLNSCEIWNFILILGLQITYYIYNPWKV